MIRRLAGALALLAGAAAAAGPVPAPRIDPQASVAAIEVDLRIGGRVQGRFGALEGELDRLPDGRLQVSVRLDARTLVLDGPGWMARSMRSPKFLDVGRHRWVHFRSDPFPAALVREGGAMAGTLQLRGVARRVAFAVDPAGCDPPGRDCPIHVSGAVSRREFGMEAYRAWLHDPVGFDFRVRLRQPERP